MKFEINWPSRFRGEYVDERWMDAGVIGILLAQP